MIRSVYGRPQVLAVAVLAALFAVPVASAAKSKT
jgi:hypothetical protein